MFLLDGPKWMVVDRYKHICLGYFESIGSFIYIYIEFPHLLLKLYLCYFVLIFVNQRMCSDIIYIYYLPNCIHLGISRSSIDT